MHKFYTITDGELFIHKNFMYTFTENIIDAINLNHMKRHNTLPGSLTLVLRIKSNLK